MFPDPEGTRHPPYHKPHASGRQPSAGGGGKVEQANYSTSLFILSTEDQKHCSIYHRRYKQKVEVGFVIY